MSERGYHPATRVGLAVATIALCLLAGEMAMRYWNWPPAVYSGWRATAAGGPVNPFGWRGQPVARPRPSDFVVVLTGGAEVECLRCPADETLDLILERALRRYNPNARVVTLGSGGYGQDQEFLALHGYFAHERADLVVSWASIAEDVAANTFRSGQPRPGQTSPKPTFALAGGDIRGPTEELGQPIYRAKLSGIFMPLFVNIDRNWSTLLPKPDPGAASAPSGMETRTLADEPLEEQRTGWSIWMSPRPARVQYGMALTRALLRHMRDLATLRGGRFVVLRTPSPAEARMETPVALGHAGHWFVADPAKRDAAIGEVTEGFDQVTLSPEGGQTDPVETERRLMTRLADALNQREMLVPAGLSRPRH